MEAERVRVRVGVPRTAPVDPVGVAEACGCEVRFMRLPSLEGVYSPVPRPVVVLGAERPAGRRAFNCAHEVGHHVFGHGIRIEALNVRRYARNKPADEFSADVFAGFLLMSQSSVRRTLKERGWNSSTVTPEQVFRLASFFGVGYGTIVNHLAWSLGLLQRDCANELLRTQPREIKARFGAAPGSEVVLVDTHWQHRAVDLEVGDTLVLPAGAAIDVGRQLQPLSIMSEQVMFRAAAPGYSRAFIDKLHWAVNMRVSRKQYEGISSYRFYEDVEED